MLNHVKIYIYFVCMWSDIYIDRLNPDVARVRSNTIILSMASIGNGVATRKGCVRRAVLLLRRPPPPHPPALSPSIVFVLMPVSAICIDDYAFLTFAVPSMLHIICCLCQGGERGRD